jgi:glutaryl-CoA dehydrogenase
MASPQLASARKPPYAPPPVDGDFYKIANVLNDRERLLIKRVREFAEGVVAPVIEEYWARDEFPFEIIPKWRGWALVEWVTKGMRRRAEVGC